MKKITMILVFFLFSCIGEKIFDKKSFIIEGEIVDFGKPDELEIDHCGLTMIVNSQILLKTVTGEEYKVYMNTKNFNSDYFNKEIYPLIKNNKNPKVKIQVTECKRKGSIKNMLGIKIFFP